MKIGAALSSITLLYVETALHLLYYTESRVGYVDKMRAIFREIHDGRIQVVTSTVTLTETLTKPLRASDTVLVNRYRLMLNHTRGLTLMPVTSRIAESAADLRARYNLRTPDALHIATAVDARCDALLTNDAGIRRVTEITVLVLDELELDPTE